MRSLKPWRTRLYCMHDYPDCMHDYPVYDVRVSSFTRVSPRRAPAALAGPLPTALDVVSKAKRMAGASVNLFARSGGTNRGGDLVSMLEPSSRRGRLTGSVRAQLA